MYKKKKSGQSRKAPYMSHTKEDVKHWSWCMNNGIGICVIPNWDNIELWKVEITINGKVSVDPKDYKGPEALSKMFDYYKYYYDKNNKNEDTL
tara:strand:+ start:5007 stop:5285 length:279 start_codon:yes stop_codon:yes gene_type:complete